MRIPFLIPGLVALFLIAMIGWFVSQPADNKDSSPGASGAVSGQGVPTSRATNRPGFQTSHESESAVTPSSENVAASFHMEMEILKKQLESSPRDTTALLKIARLKQDAHQLDEAVEYYQRYLSLVPVGRQARLDLTQCFGGLDKWDDALSLTQESLVILPDDAGLLYNLGAIYANTGKFDEARKIWLVVSGQDDDVEMQSKAKSSLDRLNQISE